MNPDFIRRDLPMPIHTPRLILRPPAPGMGQALHDAKCESLPQLTEWFGWEQKDMSAEADEVMLRKQMAKFITREDFMLMVFDKRHRLVGCSGFHYVNNFKTPIMHVGYWIRRSEQGKGYVTEWVNALTRYGFDVLGLKKLSIHSDSENQASIAERLGFPMEYASRWGTAKHGTDAMRTLNVYSRFDTHDLPPLNVAWGDTP